MDNANTPQAMLENVRVRPALLEHLPGTNPYSGTTIYPNIYVSREVYENLAGEQPDPRYLALIQHEQVHVRHIRARGALGWYVRYFVSPKFRLAEELEGYRAQFAYLKATNIDPALERRARALSGAAYLWCTNYRNAYAKLQAIWENTEGYLVS